MNLEKLILKGLITNDKYLKLVLPYLKEDYFVDPTERKSLSLIFEYYNKYRSLPKINELMIELDGSAGLSQEVYTNTKKVLQDVETGKLEENIDWLIDKTEKFCQEKAIYNAMLKSMHILEGKEKKHTVGQIPSLLSEALAVGFDADVGHDYIDDVEEQFSYYNKVVNLVRFDLDILNIITNGGIPEKTLSVILAGVHVGKTMFMCHMAGAAMTMGYDVLYITLEMSKNEIVKRIDANLMNVPINELKQMTKAEYMKKASVLKANVKGKLKVREFPTASSSTLQIRGLLDEMKMKKGFVPQLIFVDYLNLLNSARYTRGGAGMYEYVKSVAEELRGIAMEYNTRIVSATQVNREGFKSSDPDMTNTSESFGLPATADFMLALVSNEQLKAMGQILAIQLKNRFGDKDTNSKFILGVDRPKMRFFDASNTNQGLTVQSKPATSNTETETREDKFRSLLV
jgi:replicative DNA helicase